MNKRALMLTAAAAALLSGQALADTNVTTKLDSPQNTASDGNITIESDGSIVITTSPPTAAAVTINSNDIVNNEGLISYKGVDAAVGVALTTGYTGEFEGTGTVDLSGTGTAKSGILITGPKDDTGSGTFTGVVPTGGGDPVAIDLETGSVLNVQGDNSFGIKELAGTNIVGDINVAGAITMTPTSATSTSTALGNLFAINLAGTMTGNLNIQTGAAITASGQGAEGIQTLGQITGAITNQGVLQTFGVANVTNPNTVQPEAGTALGIGNSVTGGIYNAGPSTASDTTTVRATISTQGNAPTVLINPAIGNSNPSAPLVIGVYNDTTDPNNSFINRGTISGTAADAGTNVITFSIVGASTTAPTQFIGGLFNGGSISATATTSPKTQSVSANALLIGDYADIGTSGLVPALTNSNESGSGVISATVTGPEAGTATAIAIEQLGSLPTINNSGTISATAVTTNPQFVTSLSAYAIFDASGTLTSITNSGIISATATTLKDNAQIAVAADLQVATKPVTFDNMGTVNGDILFGSYNDSLTLLGTAQTPASVTGNVSFGGNSSCSSANPPCGNDSLSIGDFSTLTGAVTETLGSHVDVSIAQGGTLNLENDPLTLGSNVIGLYAGSFTADTGANIGLIVSQPFNIVVSPQAGALIQAQNASIGDFTNFKITFGSYIGNFVTGQGFKGGSQTALFDLISTPKGEFSISQTELDLIETDFSSTIPFLFTGGLCTWNINGRSTCTGPNPGNSQVVLELTPKSAQTLGLTGYALQMFPYANQALIADDTLGAALVNDVSNAQQAQAAYAAFAPDVSGAQRALAVSLTDSATNVVAARQRTLREYASLDGDLTLWDQEFVQRLNQDTTSAASGYTDTGFGFALGADEGDPQDGRYGGAFTFFSGGTDAKQPVLQKTNSEWYMLTGYSDWRGRAFFLDTQGTVGYARMNGSRTINLSGFTRTASDTRPAEYLAGGVTAGAQYQVYGAALMPQISFDGLAMRQEGYTETSGAAQADNGFDLHVNPSYAASLRAFAGVDARDDLNMGDFLFQPEARAGYRYDFANGQESVKASFVDVVPLTQFEISGPKPSPGNALAGAGVSFSTGAWSIGLSFDYLHASSGNTSEEGTFTLLGRI